MARQNAEIMSIEQLAQDGKLPGQKVGRCWRFHKDTLDDPIGAQARKLAAFQRHKKGLMQQLFPMPAEVRA